jgi:hypothetical protein
MFKFIVIFFSLSTSAFSCENAMRKELEKSIQNRLYQEYSLLKEYHDCGIPQDILYWISIGKSEAYNDILIEINRFP